MPRVFAIVCLSLWPSVAFAQSIYVGAAAGIDTILASRFEAEGTTQADRGGTTPGLAVRAGIEMGQRWGAEVEAAHALTLERSDTTAFPPGGGVVFISPGFTPRFTVDTKQEMTAVNALGWVSYPASARVDVVLVAGGSFNRTEVEQRFRLEPFPSPGFPSRVVIGSGPQRTRFTTYGVGPLVGIETRVAFGDHFRVVPAFRMSGVGVGLSLRPTVGALWMF